MRKCTKCKKHPIEVKKWGLCKKCYKRLLREGKLEKNKGTQQRKTQNYTQTQTKTTYPPLQLKLFGPSPKQLGISIDVNEYKANLRREIAIDNAKRNNKRKGNTSTLTKWSKVKNIIDEMNKEGVHKKEITKSQQNELCVCCQSTPFFYKKWHLCKYCYQILRDSNILKKLPQYTKEPNKNQIVPTETIIKLLDKGLTTAQIAQLHNVSRQAIHCRINQDDYKKLKQIKNYEILFLYRIGFLITEIEDMMKCSGTKVRYAVKKYNITPKTYSYNNYIKRTKGDVKENRKKNSDNSNTYENRDKNSSVGRSAVTPFKQSDLQKLFKLQIKYNNNHPYIEDTIYYIDCTAGDMLKNENTSPEIFLNALSKHNNTTKKLFLIEKNKNTFQTLRQNYMDRWEKEVIYNDNLSVLLKNLNMIEVLPNIAPNKHRSGLLYFDSNGGKKEEFETIFSFLKNNPNMDIILNINIVNLIKLRGAGIKNISGFEKYQEFYLSTIISSLQRDNIWIRNNVQIDKKVGKTKYKFVMLFGTNNNNFKMDKTLNFNNINSFEGQKLIYKYNFTKKEKELFNNDSEHSNKCNSN